MDLDSHSLAFDKSTIATQVPPSVTTVVARTKRQYIRGSDDGPKKKKQKIVSKAIAQENFYSAQPWQALFESRGVDTGAAPAGLRLQRILLQAAREEEPKTQSSHAALVRQPPPRSVWKTFGKQHEALQFVRDSQELLHVFSAEYRRQCGGARWYLVTTLEEFWRRYESMSAAERNYYEVRSLRSFFTLCFTVPS